MDRVTSYTVEPLYSGHCVGRPPDYGLMRYDQLFVVHRVWHPGPEDGRDLEGLGIWKRVYLEYGFVFIQDMVERALIEEIVNGELEGGRERGGGREGGIFSKRGSRS